MNTDTTEAAKGGESRTSALLCADDFKPINFGVLVAEKDGNEFIFQRPFHGDTKRAAQEGCVLFINGEKQDVDEFGDALIKCIYHLGA
jgi:hypothetical protein